MIIYSNPKSPAFVETQIIKMNGNMELTERVGNLKFKYPYNSFFQINPSEFSKVIIDFQKILKKTRNVSNLVVADIYAGVGTLGLSIADFVNKVIGVEVTTGSDKYALQNAQENKIFNYTFVCGKAEDLIEINIANANMVILDPPRSGLHPKVINSLIKVKPQIIFYLSCNPKTQAQDFSKLKDSYKIYFNKAYNFYPHTTHVENLIALKLN